MDVLSNTTSAISVLVDSQDKENANEILKSLGLNMSTFVNMAIKQLLYKNGLPFEVKNPNNTDQVNTNNTIEIEDYHKNNKKSLKSKYANMYSEINNMPDLRQFINGK